jgi:DNA topoisomerase-1
MNEGLFDATSVIIHATGAKPEPYVFRASGQKLKFPGWLVLYDKGSSSKPKSQSVEGQDSNTKSEENVLPDLTLNDPLHLIQILPQQKFTEPPARFNEASLIKMLEEKGIGRPSTYAPIISTIQDRKYVEKIERKFQPTDLGMTVSDFLISNFPEIFDVLFTARMEDDLDNIANGTTEWVTVMKNFYGPFAEKLESVFKVADRVKVDLGTTDEICPKCGKPLAIRMSKFGKFLACTGFPECTFKKSIVEKFGLPCPKCGGDMLVKKTRFGKQFYGCSNYPTCIFATWKNEDNK